MSAGDGFSCCHDCVLGTGQLCCAVISFTFITNKSVLCHSFTPVFCLYESVHVHNEMHLISLTAFIWEVKFSLILQTTPCSFKVQSISHNNSASIQLSVASQIICLCWSICYLYSFHDLGLLCRAKRMANSLNWQLVSVKENAIPL